jgi:hypothetical protein
MDRNFAGCLGLPARGANSLLREITGNVGDRAGISK